MSSPFTEHIVELISGEQSVAVFFEAPPEIVVMPFAKDHSMRYICINLFVTDAAIK